MLTMSFYCNLIESGRSANGTDGDFKFLKEMKTLSLVTCITAVFISLIKTVTC